MLKLRKKIALRKMNKRIDKMSFKKEIWETEKPYIKDQNIVEEEKKELSEERKEIKFPSWSKLLSLLLFFNFSVLEIFIGWVTVKSFSLAFTLGIGPDFTPLITLISAVLGETISYAIYCLKSKAENTKNGIVYDLAMRNYPDEEIEN